MNSLARIPHHDAEPTALAINDGEIKAAVARMTRAQLVYEVPGRGLAPTYDGIKLAVWLLNQKGLARIGLSRGVEPRIDETDEFIDATVFAEDTLNGGGAWGTKRQPKRDDRGRPINGPREQALSKASRNALKSLVPQEVINRIIAAATGGPATNGASRPATIRPVEEVLTPEQVWEFVTGEAEKRKRQQGGSGAANAGAIQQLLEKLATAVTGNPDPGDFEYAVVRGLIRWLFDEDALTSVAQLVALQRWAERPSFGVELQQAVRHFGADVVE